MVEMKNANKTFIGKPEGKRACETSIQRWEDNIRMDRREMGLEGTDWIHLAQDWDQWQALVNTVMNLQIP
jgi:hypothetical protein